MNGNLDSQREIPMNYELYLCVLPISILFPIVSIPNLINYIYKCIYIISMCVCVCSFDVFVCTNRSKIPQEISESGTITEGGGLT